MFVAITWPGHINHCWLLKIVHVHGSTVRGCIHYIILLLLKAKETRNITMALYLLSLSASSPSLVPRSDSSSTNYPQSQSQSQSHSWRPYAYHPRRSGWTSDGGRFWRRGLYFWTTVTRKRFVVRMAPDEEKMTRRSPLDFPIEWERPGPGRRPDIFPQFSPMKTPLPPPLPADPPEEEEEEEEKKEEDDPDKEPEKPEE